MAGATGIDIPFELIKRWLGDEAKEQKAVVHFLVMKRC